MKTLTIRKPDDFHVHLRDAMLLKQVAPYTAKHFARALVMPNTKPPILTGKDAVDYYWKIKKALDGFKEGENLIPLLTIKLTDETTTAIIREARKLGVIAAKLYPRGATTNSDDGVSDVEKLGHVFEEMQKVGMVLSVHGEMYGSFDLDAEWEFYKGPFWWIYLKFEELKIVWEHVTTELMIGLLKRYPERVAVTITAHHLVLTLSDALENMSNYCKPLAKRPEDREILIRIATSGDPRFFFGSDSAPHYWWTKGKLFGKTAAGVFSSPVVLAVLAQIFEEAGALDKLENFVSRFGAEFYGLPLNTETIKLVKKPWKVLKVYPREVENTATDLIVPLLAGQTLNWQVEA